MKYIFYLRSTEYLTYGFLHLFILFVIKDVFLDPFRQIITLSFYNNCF